MSDYIQRRTEKEVANLFIFLRSQIKDRHYNFYLDSIEDEIKQLRDRIPTPTPWAKRISLYKEHRRLTKENTGLRQELEQYKKICESLNTKLHEAENARR